MDLDELVKYEELRFAVAKHSTSARNPEDCSVLTCACNIEATSIRHLLAFQYKETLGDGRSEFLISREITMSTLKTGEASTGSLWNKNSWHWEEKDYNKVAHKMIQEQLATICLDSPSGDTLRFESIEPKGFCSISVRKAKKVVIFEFAISMIFKIGSDEGSVKIPEFSNDELDPVIRVDMKSEQDSVREFVRKQGAVEIKRALNEFVQFINTVETGSDVLASDKERRAHELEIARKAEEEKGEEKKKIADVVKEQERVAIAGKDLVEASVWNVNSYHWETRNLRKWAEEWIQAKLLSKPSSFSDLEIKGEAENSIRKGKKISIFNLSIAGKFNGVDFQVPCFSNEEGDDEIPKVKTDGNQKELITELKKRVFTDFLTEMKKQ
jgi:activator of HSP90 ATPase